MNIVFFGSSQFGLPALKALIDAGHKVRCVVTQPDRKKGRGLIVARTVIKDFALKSGLKVYQPEKINAPGAINFLKKINPDLFVVIAYGQILSQGLLDIPGIMPLNAHGSLLPRYRGAAPINWAIIKGETQTGITIIKMTEKMDAGPIIAKRSMAINDNDTHISLENRLSGIAAGLLIEAVNSIASNNYDAVPQDESKVSFAPKLKREDGLIHWNKPARDIYNLIRGCLGWPDAFTYYNGKRLKIYKAIVVEAAGPANAEPGKVVEVSRQGITVATAGGNLIIKELQLEGGRRMDAEEFIAGHKKIVAF